MFKNFATSQESPRAQQHPRRPVHGIRSSILPVFGARSRMFSAMKQKATTENRGVEQPFPNFMIGLGDRAKRLKSKLRNWGGHGLANGSDRSFDRLPLPHSLSLRLSLSLSLSLSLFLSNIYIYICMCTYIHICVYIHVYIYYTRMHNCAIYIYIHIHTHVHTYADCYVFMYTQICVGVRVYIMYASILEKKLYVYVFHSPV